jgi:catechol 2,3-dioxygenase
MSAIQLPDETLLSRVDLRVRDLGRMVDFYTHIVGLKVVESTGAKAAISATGKRPALLVLNEDIHAAPRLQRTTGLYHLAFRFSTRRDLAHALQRLVMHDYGIEGASDHLISEAIYLSDPEGNGVELYTDRPRAEWPRRNGQIEVENRPLDLAAMLASVGTAPPPPDAPPGTDIGHIHLHVSDLAAAKRFYHEFLGFDLTMRLPGASFFAAGGYHHHIGVNTWAGTTPATSNGVGLISYRFEVPVAEVLYCLQHRAPLAGYEARTLKSESGAELLQIRDPNGNWLEMASSKPAEFAQAQARSESADVIPH